MAIRHLAFGIHVDSDVPIGTVRIERQSPDHPRRVDIFAGAELAGVWIRMDGELRLKLFDWFTDVSDGLYRVPWEVSLQFAIDLPDELWDVVNGLLL